MEDLNVALRADDVNVVLVAESLRVRKGSDGSLNVQQQQYAIAVPRGTRSLTTCIEYQSQPDLLADIHWSAVTKDSIDPFITIH